MDRGYTDPESDDWYEEISAAKRSVRAKDVPEVTRVTEVPEVPEDMEVTEVPEAPAVVRLQTGTYDGAFVYGDKSWPIKLQLVTNGSEISSAYYTNVTYDLGFPVEGYYEAGWDAVVFTNPAQKNFCLRLSLYPHDGVLTGVATQDGQKDLDAILYF